MKQTGFSYIEVLVSFFLFLTALLWIGGTQMTSLRLIGKGKINQRATLLLMEKIEELRIVPIQDLAAGDYSEPAGTFQLQWRIRDHTPFFGTKQLYCAVMYQPAASIVVESIFYRSE